MRLLAVFALAWCSLLADAAVLVYHRFDDGRFPTTSISTDKLREDFAWLKANQYHVIPLENLVDTLQKGQPVPPKTVVLTIDDGYRSFYESGLEVFKEFGYPFTLFVYTEATDGNFSDFMSWETLREVSQYGSVQLHTHSHPHLTRLDDSALENEIAQAAALFEENMGYRARFLAYPYGEYDTRVREAHRAHGFEALFNYNGGIVGQKADLFNLDRTGVSGRWPIKSLVDRTMLNVRWEALEVQDGHIGAIRAILPESKAKQVLLVVTGYPDRWIEAKDGLVEIDYNQPIKNRRTLVALKDGQGGIATRLIIKKE